MRIFTAQLEVETNSFSPLPTGHHSFLEYGIFRGGIDQKPPETGPYSYLTQLRRICEADGHTVIDGLRAFAMPGGPVVRSAYEWLKEEILRDLRGALPVDLVLLMLHGAMIADGYDDCEGGLLVRIRDLVGSRVVVGAEVDLHCHFTEQMRGSADLIIAYKEYPHTDILERAEELYRLGVRTVKGEIHPTTAAYDCRMVGLWHTPVEPVKGFVQTMRDLEQQPGVLSISFGHGEPDGDTAESGAKIWVITDNDPAKADALAQQLGRTLWEMRESATATCVTIDEALQELRSASDGPIVLADLADNAGGGAPSDSNFILQRLLEQGVTDVCLGYYWDLGAIQICREAGLGARMTLRIGGKCGLVSGQPIDLDVTVRSIVERHSQSGLGTRWPLGTAVWLEAAVGLDVVLTSIRAPVLGPDGFTSLGIDLARHRIIVVKSMQHFYEGFAPLAKQIIYVGGPGALATNYAQVPYKRRSLNYWPRVANPFLP